MSDCERCGEKIGLVPRICWRCFYQFWNVQTPEQKNIIRQLQQVAVDEFRGRLLEELREVFRVGSKDTSIGMDGKVWFTESKIRGTIHTLDKELYDDEG